MSKEVSKNFDVIFIKNKEELVRGINALKKINQKVFKTVEAENNFLHNNGSDENFNNVFLVKEKRKWRIQYNFIGETATLSDLEKSINQK